MKWKICSIFALSLLVGVLLVVQTRTVNGQHLYVSPKAVDDYKVAIQGEEQDLENMKERLAETNEKLEEYERLKSEEGALQEELDNRLREDLSLYSSYAGAVAMKGPGVEIFIDDATRELEFWETPNDILVHDRDLLEVINELKAAGAEAISLNGQRLVDSSYIMCSGHTVRINGQTFASPYKINAIGDSARMTAALIGPAGAGSRLSQWIIFKIQTVDDVVIPAYTEGYSYQYKTPVTAETSEKEGEKN